MARAWAPVLKYLNDKTGYRLMFETAKDIPTFEQRRAKGSYDFAYISPYTYTVLHRSRGVHRMPAAEPLLVVPGIVCRCHQHARQRHQRRQSPPHQRP